MTREVASMVYDLLVHSAGANPADKENFIGSHLDIPDHGSEWRFQGLLGFGGKFYTDGGGTNFRVGCYPEDETTISRLIIAKLNSRLRELERSLA